MDDMSEDAGEEVADSDSDITLTDPGGRMPNTRRRGKNRYCSPICRSSEETVFDGCSGEQERAGITPRMGLMRTGQSLPLARTECSPDVRGPPRPEELIGGPCARRRAGTS
jgi:hypothetical protein